MRNVKCEVRNVKCEMCSVWNVKADLLKGGGAAVYLS